MPYGNVLDARITTVTKDPVPGLPPPPQFTYKVTVEAYAIPPFKGVVVAPKAKLYKRDAGGESQLMGTSEQTMTPVAGVANKYTTQFTFNSLSLANTVIMAYVKANWQVPVVDEERTAPWTLP